MLLSATPSKRLLRALAVDITRLDALTDLVDNAWDQWVAAGKRGTLQITVQIDTKDKKIVIGDNAGGISYDNLGLLLAPGGSSREQERGIFGLYGVGAKRALYTLGDHAEILTRAKGEVGYTLTVTKEWFENDQGDDRWKIPYEENPSVPEGTTTITITELRASWVETDVEQARAKLGSTYGALLQAEKMTVSFNGLPLAPPEPILWAKSKNVPPTVIKTRIRVPKEGRFVSVELTVGVTVNAAPLSEIGFDVICNGRLVVPHVSDYRLGFEQNRLGSPHQTLNRFRGVVSLEGDPRDIPWNSAKNDLNLNHPIHRELLSLVVEVAWPFTSFLRKNYRYSTTEFTHVAGESDFHVVRLRPGGALPRLVKPLRRGEAQPTVSFKVTKQELDNVAAFISYQDRTRSEIGRYVWDYFLEQVMVSE